MTQNKLQAELSVIQAYEAWSFFCTWTFKSPVPSETVARELVFAHLYRCADLFRVPFRRLVWVVRCERGEKFGRLHYHGLIGGPKVKATIGGCFTLNHLWEELNPRCGMSRHRVFDRHQNGPGYCAKSLSYPETFGADHYEVRKFGDELSQLTLSASLLRSVGERGASARDSEQGNKPQSKNDTMRNRKGMFSRITGGATVEGASVCEQGVRMVSVRFRGGRLHFEAFA